MGRSAPSCTRSASLGRSTTARRGIIAIDHRRREVSMAKPLGPSTRMVQEQPMLDASITAIHPAGYTIEIHLHSKGFDELDATIDALEQLGYRPTGSGDGWLRTPEGQPICPRHKVVMHTREKQGDTWH